MRFRSITAVALILVPSILFGQTKKDNGYTYTVDLTKVVDDRVLVQLSPPAITSKEVTFYLPKIVPGTYAIADYGRYVKDFKAVDKKGKELSVEKVDENTWKIKNADKLATITYWVDDSFDTSVTGPEIFWPAGTNIEDKKNFVINTSGFFGYFDGVKETPFRFNVVRTKDLYGSTGLIPVQIGASPSSLKLEKISDDKDKAVDTYQATDYDQLVDSPLMYSKPDTAIVRVANTEVLIGSYSPNNKITAKQVAESIKEVLMAQKEYLGGTLPVEKYAFIFYFSDKPSLSYGALEHSYSSMYYFPEMPIEQIDQQLKEVAAHEFFHIMTPLTIHSKEIADFDFNSPKMSQHLWLYEGVTEYFAGNVLVKYGIISAEEYMQIIQEKMFTTDQFKNDLAFTELSKYTLDKYHDQYNNVYMKGALIGLCLDIRLRQLSQGKYGLRNLILDLSKKYGKDKAFNDDELFPEIVKMTYPEIEDFINRYIKGSEPLPLEQTLNSVGILYKGEEKFKDYSLGIGQSDVGVTLVNDKQMLEIATTDHLNEMGKALGFQKGDVLTKINGETIPDLGPELSAFIQKHVMALSTSKTVSFTVLRKDDKGERKEVELSTPVVQVELSRKHLLSPNPEATAEQLALRDSWLKP
jgi:predicted metalloprotease with PDZ domain